jgi:hypothetical protein
MDHEQGLTHLKQLAMGKSWNNEFLLFEAQLRENLEQQRRYGDEDSNRVQRAKIMDRLNQLAFSHLGISFNDLCKDTTATAQKSVPSSDHSQGGRGTNMPRKPPSGGKVATTGTARTDAFVSFNSKDKPYLEELQTHLAFFIRKEAINIWDNTKILPGSKWAEETRKALQAAKIAVLLISSDFLASDAIAQNELPSLLAAAEQEGVIILPVIVRASVFEYSELAQFKPINEPSEPLSELSRGKRDVIWQKVARIVSDTLKAAKGDE